MAQIFILNIIVFNASTFEYFKFVQFCPSLHKNSSVKVFSRWRHLSLRVYLIMAIDVLILIDARLGEMTSKLMENWTVLNI